MGGSAWRLLLLVKCATSFTCDYEVLTVFHGIVPNSKRSDVLEKLISNFNKKNGSEASIPQNQRTEKPTMHGDPSNDD